ncbi:MAG TPA: adenosylcobinamide-GDP ribazoletransferase [Bryobacteraceae bacterium]|jgi:adenosylcobinamide-GDP ribazoletransferase|nr:adenosylcobinamide-GDP ribazoletransferase [Bryobacteraceae bacterium]
MIRQFAAAIAFLTRVPMLSRMAFGAKDIGRSARWFPLVGLLIGGCLVAALQLFTMVFPALLTAFLIAAMDALLTGALHLDGLADTADGFGGGRSREDVLRIMRDHAIGSYGAVALVLVIAVKATALAAMIDRHQAAPWLALMPMLGRWSLVLLSATQPYARRSDKEGAPPGGSVTDFVGRVELIVASATALPITFALVGWRGLAAALLVIAVSGIWGWYCRRRIGGITGDTLGASVEISETLVLLFGLSGL